MNKPALRMALSLILISMLILAPAASWGRLVVLGFAGDTATTVSTPVGSYVVFSQGFDNETSGATPKSWTYLPSYGNFFVDNSSDYLGKGKSARFVDNSTSGSPGARTYFLQQRGIFAVTFALLLVNNTGINTGLEVRVDDGSGAGANIIFGDNVIEYRDHYGGLTTLRGSYVPNRWYEIKMVLNVPGGVYSIYIDEHLEVRDVGFAGGGPSQISRMVVDETSSSNPGSLMPVGNIDDIEVRRCIVVPFDYPTIQDAINVANPGDIVFVTKQQRYFESLVINKGNLTLVGEDPQTTILDGRFYQATPDRVSVSGCSYVSISGFTITFSEAGGSQVKVVNCNNVIVSNNIIVSGLGDGIEVSGSNDTVTGNTIQSNLGCGIRVSGQYHSVFSNVIDSNDECGIRLESASDNLIMDNTIRNNKIGLSCGGETYRTTIYQNRFVGNVFQAVDNGHNNKWDNGYPYKPAEKKGGGNYWSDYNSSVDVYSGPGQNEQVCSHYPSPDGICDQPYNITPNEVDDYPLFPIQNVTQYPKLGSIDYTTNVFATATVLPLVNILNATINVNYGSSNQTITMQKSSDDNWTGTIPHKPYGTQVNYTIRVLAESASWLNSTYYPQNGPYFVDDFTPPTFPASPTWAPRGPDENETIIVSANVTEPADASQVGRVLLFYPVGNSTWWTQMNKVADFNSTQSNTSMWTATFPRQPGNATFVFNITAFDRAGNSAVESNSTFVKQLAQLSVQYNNGTLADDPAIIDFATMARKTSANTIFKVVNLGQDVLNWSMVIVNGGNWLSLNSSRGTTLGGQTTDVRVTVNTTSLTQPIVYAGELAINANGTVSQWAVVVTLTIRYIIIDESWASVNASNRVDVNTTEFVGFHTEWAGNCSDATGGTVVINNIPGLTQSANDTGWAVFNRTFSEPGQRAFYVSNVSFSGITDFSQIALRPTIIWDRLNITLSIADQWIDVGSNAVVSWKGVHESDGSAFKGNISLNDTTFHDKVGEWDLTTSSIVDSEYPSLTVFDSNSISCIWDRIEIIAAGTSDKQVDVNQTATVWFIAVYRFENKVFKGNNGTLYVNGDPLVWNPITELWARDYKFGTAGTRAFSVTAVDDEVHGLTRIQDDVGQQKITWGPTPPETSWWQQWLNPGSGTSTSSNSASNQASQTQDINATAQAQTPPAQSALEAFPWQSLVIIIAAGVGMAATMVALVMSGDKHPRKDRQNGPRRSK